MGKAKARAHKTEESSDDPPCHSVANVSNVKKAVTRIKSAGNKGKKSDRDWICLACGIADKEHFSSSSHKAGINIGKREAWCFKCDHALTENKVSKALWKQITECKTQVSKIGVDQMEDSEPEEATSTNDHHTNNYHTNDFSQVDEVQSSGGGPKPAAKSEKVVVRGLQNLGNTCFFNSVMQVLSDTTPMQQMFERPEHGQYPLQREVRGLVQAMQGSAKPQPGNNNKRNTSSAFSPTSLFGQICKTMPMFRGARQQDAHELLRFVMGAMDEEEIQAAAQRRKDRAKAKMEQWDTQIVLAFVDSLGLQDSKPFTESLLNLPEPFTGARLSNLLDKWNTKEGKATRALLAFPSLASDQQMLQRGLQQLKAGTSPFLHSEGTADQTGISSVFAGQLENTVTCLHCGTESRKPEPFFDLSLPIAPPKVIKYEALPVFRPKKGELVVLNNKKKDSDTRVQKASKSQRKAQLKQQKKEAKLLRRKASKLPGGQEEEEEEETLLEDKEKENNKPKSDHDVDHDEEEENEEEQQDEITEQNETTTSTLTSSTTTSSSSTSTSTSSSISFSQQQQPTNDTSDEATITFHLSQQLENVSVNETTTTTETTTTETTTKTTTAETTTSVETTSTTTTTTETTTEPAETTSSTNQAATNGISESEVKSNEGKDRVAESPNSSEFVRSPASVIDQFPPWKKKYLSILETLKTRGYARLESDGSRLKECLYAFTDEEILAGSNSYGCERCTELERQKANSPSAKLCAEKALSEENKTSSEDWEVVDHPEAGKAHEEPVGVDQASDENGEKGGSNGDMKENGRVTEESKVNGATLPDSKDGLEEEVVEKVRIPLVKREAVKKLTVLTAPTILTLHLKRFYHAGRGFEKNQKNIRFGPHLNLGPFLSRPTKTMMYALYGVVVHMGSMGGGHYVAYVKKGRRALAAVARNDEDEDGDSHYDDGGQWYYFSDSQVQGPIPEAEVLSQQAYILFYQKIETAR